jgi:hypothetical protein
MSTRRISAGPRRSRSTRDRDVFPSFDEIAQRAHEIFVAQGKPIGRAVECWHLAEDELLDRAARRAIAQ